MLNDKKILAVIPARGGSKRIKNKNIRPLCSKPLIVWTIEAAKRSRYIDRVVLSSEDPDIINIARQAGCDIPFVRPAELSTDTVPGSAPILHALENLPGYDYLVVLQPTCPMRTTQDIDQALEKCIGGNFNSCVSVSEVTQNPGWMFRTDTSGRMSKFLDGELAPRSQELPTLVRLNGAIYIANTSWLEQERKLVSDESIAFVMPEESSFDIDTEKDFRLTELYMQNFIMNKPADNS